MLILLTQNVGVSSIQRQFLLGKQIKCSLVGKKNVFSLSNLTKMKHLKNMPGRNALNTSTSRSLNKRHSLP